MLTHLVMMQLSTPEFAADFAAQLNALEGQIPGLLSMQAGVEFADGEYDLGLVSTFTNRGALIGYQAHPAHLAVTTALKPLIMKRAVCDFETPTPTVATPEDAS